MDYTRITLATLILMTTALLAACRPPAPPVTGEIREYQGQPLSSVNDFRENSIKGPQIIDIKSYQLKISGLVQNPKTYSYDQVLNGFKHDKRVITLDCVEGWGVTLLWEGVYIKDLLAAAGTLPAAKTVIFRSYDGFTTSEPIDYITGSGNILLAYKMNEITIPPERGFPFMLAAENKWGYKWAKWVTEIELSDDANYHGYWEGLGYSNSGDLDKPFFD